MQADSNNGCEGVNKNNRFTYIDNNQWSEAKSKKCLEKSSAKVIGLSVTSVVVGLTALGVVVYAVKKYACDKNIPESVNQDQENQNNDKE